jgi:hypothetical protein
MFAAPPVIEAGVFTAIPQEYWQRGRASEWVNDLS